MASILVEILGNAKQFKSELDSAVASTEKANSGFSKMQQAAGVAGLAIAGGLAVGLHESVNAAEEAQQSTARLNAAFAASHVSVNAFRGGIEEAEGAGRRLGFMNDDVKNSLGSLVIATHDGNKAITDLGVAEDIARFKHISLESATKIMTAAMAGSTRATKQLGIDIPKVTTAQDALSASVKDHTTAVYKAELAHAKLQDKMSTENAVIATVSEKLHGQAKAYSDTAAGGMAQFHAQMNNMEETIGNALIPAITQMAQILARLMAFFSEHTTITKLLVVALGALAGILLAVSVATKAVEVAQTVARAATLAWTAAQWLLNAALDANSIGLVIVAVAALTAAVILAYQHSATFRQIVSDAFNAVKVAANAVLDFFRGAWTAVQNLIVAPFNAVSQAAQSGFGLRPAIVGAFDDIKSFVRDNWPIIAVLISGPFAPLVAVATNAFGIRSALQGAITTMVGAASDGANNIAGYFARLPGRIVSALGDVSKLLYNQGEQIIQGLIDGITSKVHHLEHLVGGLAGKISSLKGPIEDDRVLLVPHGQAIIQGLQAGLESGLSSLGSMTAGIAPAISQTVAAAPIATPTVAAGGGGTVNITVNGWVGTDQQIAEKLRNELIRIGRNTSGGALGGFA